MREWARHCRRPWGSMHAVAAKGMQLSCWICLGVRLAGASRTSYQALSHTYQDGRAALGSPVHTSGLCSTDAECL